MPKAKVAVERHPLASSLSRFGLTMAHVVPLDYLNNVKRIHVKWPVSDHHWSVANDCREMFDLLDSILCRGGRLLADINNGKITRSGQCYPGLLYVETANATNHIEVTFEGLCHSGTKVLDLGDEVMKQLLICLLNWKTYPENSFLRIVERRGKAPKTTGTVMSAV